MILRVLSGSAILLALVWFVWFDGRFEAAITALLGVAGALSADRLAPKSRAASHKVIRAVVNGACVGLPHESFHRSHSVNSCVFAGCSGPAQAGPCDVVDTSAYTKVYESVCPVGVGVHCETLWVGSPIASG